MDSQCGYWWREPNGLELEGLSWAKKGSYLLILLPMDWMRLKKIKKEFDLGFVRFPLNLYGLGGIG